MIYFWLVVVWALCVFVSAAVTHAAEPYVDGSGGEHRYGWGMGALLGLILGPFGFIVSAMYVAERTPDGHPKVAVDHTPARPRKRRRWIR